MRPLLIFLISVSMAAAEEDPFAEPTYETYERVEAVAEAPPEGTTHWAQAEFAERLTAQRRAWEQELQGNPALEQFQMFAETGQFTGADKLKVQRRNGKLEAITIFKDGQELTIHLTGTRNPPTTFVAQVGEERRSLPVRWQRNSDGVVKAYNAMGGRFPNLEEPGAAGRFQPVVVARAELSRYSAGNFGLRNFDGGLPRAASDGVPVAIAPPSRPGRNIPRDLHIVNDYRADPPAGADERAAWLSQRRGQLDYDMTRDTPLHYWDGRKLMRFVDDDPDVEVGYMTSLDGMIFLHQGAWPPHTAGGQWRDRWALFRAGASEDGVRAPARWHSDYGEVDLQPRTGRMGDAYSTSYREEVRWVTRRQGRRQVRVEQTVRIPERRIDLNAVTRTVTATHERSPAGGRPVALADAQTTTTLRLREPLPQTHGQPRPLREFRGVDLTGYREWYDGHSGNVLMVRQTVGTLGAEPPAPSLVRQEQPEIRPLSQTNPELFASLPASGLSPEPRLTPLRRRTEASWMPGGVARMVPGTGLGDTAEQMTAGFMGNWPTPGGRLQPSRLPREIPEIRSSDGAVVSRGGVPRRVDLGSPLAVPLLPVAELPGYTAPEPTPIRLGDAEFTPLRRRPADIPFMPSLAALDLPDIAPRVEPARSFQRRRLTPQPEIQPAEPIARQTFPLPSFADLPPAPLEHIPLPELTAREEPRLAAAGPAGLLGLGRRQPAPFDFERQVLPPGPDSVSFDVSEPLLPPRAERREDLPEIPDSGPQIPRRRPAGPPIENPTVEMDFSGPWNPLETARRWGQGVQDWWNGGGREQVGEALAEAERQRLAAEAEAERQRQAAEAEAERQRQEQAAQAERRRQEAAEQARRDRERRQAEELARRRRSMAEGEGEVEQMLGDIDGMLDDWAMSFNLTLPEATPNENVRRTHAVDHMTDYLRAAQQEWRRGNTRLAEQLIIDAHRYGRDHGLHNSGGDGGVSAPWSLRRWLLDADFDPWAQGNPRLRRQYRPPPSEGWGGGYTIPR